MAVEKVEKTDGIWPRELADMIAGGQEVQLIDIREPWEAAIACIEGAELIPMGTLGGQLDRIREDVPVVLYCHTGVRTERVLTALHERGYDNVVHLKGGIALWTADVDQSLSLY